MMMKMMSMVLKPCSIMGHHNKDCIGQIRISNKFVVGEVVGTARLEIEGEGMKKRTISMATTRMMLRKIEKRITMTRVREVVKTNNSFMTMSKKMLTVATMSKDLLRIRIATIC